MTLSHEQLELVRAFFDRETLSNNALQDDLIDHCCTGIEELMMQEELNFETAFRLMQQRLVPNGALEIETDLKYLETYKPRIIMKKFVFASGYISTVCMIVGVVMIAMSFFKQESAQMDREKNQKAAEMVFYEKSPGAQRDQVFRDFEFMQAQRDLEALEEANSLFSLGQMLLVLSVALFSVTILPYYFYSKYQRDVLHYQQV